MRLPEPSEGPQKCVLPPCHLPLPPSRGCQQPAGWPGSWPSSPAGCQRPSIFSPGLVLQLDEIFQTNNWIVKGISCHRTVWEGRGRKEEPQPGGPSAAWEAGPACSCLRPPTPGQQGVALEAAVCLSSWMLGSESGGDAGWDVASGAPRASVHLGGALGRRTDLLRCPFMSAARQGELFPLIYWLKVTGLA